MAARLWSKRQGIKPQLHRARLQVCDEVIAPVPQGVYRTRNSLCPQKRHALGDVPQELGCGSVTCWRRLRDWQERGIWDLLHFALLDWLEAPVARADGKRFAGS
jgi:hypothetical protein